MVADVEVGVLRVVGDKSILERPNFGAGLVEFVVEAPVQVSAIVVAVT